MVCSVVSCGVLRCPVVCPAVSCGFQTYRPSVTFVNCAKTNKYTFGSAGAGDGSQGDKSLEFVNHQHRDVVGNRNFQLNGSGRQCTIYEE